MSRLFQVLNNNFKRTKVKHAKREVERAAAAEKLALAGQGGRGKRNTSNLDACLLTIKIMREQKLSRAKAVKLACADFPKSSANTVYSEFHNYCRVLTKRGML